MIEFGEALVCIQQAYKLVVRRLLGHANLLVVQDLCDATLVVLGLQVESVDDVPEEIERRRPRVPEEVVEPLVCFNERVDRLPGRPRDDVALAPESLEECLAWDISLSFRCP